MDGVYVDGYDPVENIVLEFHGCLFHGCLKCFPYRHTRNPFYCLTMESKNISNDQELIQSDPTSCHIIWKHYIKILKEK